MRSYFKFSFLDFYQSELEKFFSYWGSKIISTIAPYAKIDGALPHVYTQSINKDFYGEWDYNLNWKPKRIPNLFLWVVAISIAQRKLVYSKIKVPILVMHSSHSNKR
jgi:alpha-beta hydrolase superfamily lysophospholipase